MRVRIQSNRSIAFRLNEKIYNCIRISDPDKNGKSQIIPANQNIPSNYLRMLDVTDQINDPKQNVIDQSHGNTGLIMAYAQSFLREEVGKMYRGEIVLRGIPEIEPADVLLITDPSTGMIGPVEVETVTHVMTRSLRPAEHKTTSRARAGRSPGLRAGLQKTVFVPMRGPAPVRSGLD